MLKSVGYSFRGGRMSFSKPPRTYPEQLSILESRGLVIDNRDFALHCLEHHNYYRISAYRFTLSAPANPDEFLPGTTFSDLWGLYCFDRQLRLLVMEALKRLEISVRSHWAYVLGHTHGSQAYESQTVFRNAYRHANALGKLDEELGRSREAFVNHFQSQYQMTRPPIWAACEVMSFGLLSRFYENMAHDKDRKAIAQVFNLSPANLESLLKHASYVRNLCAHHSRLWNRRLTLTIQLPKHHPEDVVGSLHPPKNRQIYNTLVLLTNIVDIVEPEYHWTHRLLALIRAQRVPVIEHMGFPEDWETRPVWMKHAHAFRVAAKGTPL